MRRLYIVEAKHTVNGKEREIGRFLQVSEALHAAIKEQRDLESVTITRVNEKGAARLTGYGWVLMPPSQALSYINSINEVVK